MFVCLFLSVLLSFTSVSAEENFVLMNAATDAIVMERGGNANLRRTPCSTFKIALSLMGFDAGILKDESDPVWPFRQGYPEYLEAWKAPQNPATWIKCSCIWYSQVLVAELGEERFHDYVRQFDYGNQDLTGKSPWLSSSLKISPYEQVLFIQKLLRKELPVSDYAAQMTKTLLLAEVWSNGWKLYGKTGQGGDGEMSIGWFVGWIETGTGVFAFAYNVRATELDPSHRIPRVKQLIIEAMGLQIKPRISDNEIRNNGEKGL